MISKYKGEKMNTHETLMQKEIEIIKALEKYTFNDRVYRYPHIPADKGKKACESYACELDLKDILLLMDDTENEDAQTGIIFSIKGIFSREVYKIRCITNLSEIHDLQMNGKTLSKVNNALYTFLVIDDYNVALFTQFLEECKHICDFKANNNELKKFQVHIKSMMFDLKTMHSEAMKIAEGAIPSFLQEKIADKDITQILESLGNLDIGKEVEEIRALCENACDIDIDLDILLSYVRILTNLLKNEPDDAPNNKLLSDVIRKLDQAIAKEVKNPTSMKNLQEAMRARIDNESDDERKFYLLNTYIDHFKSLCNQYLNDSSVFIAYSEFLQYLVEKEINSIQKKYYLSLSIDNIILQILFCKLYVVNLSLIN
jgi:hypothetical protein